MIKKALYSLYDNFLKLSNSESISIAYLLKLAGYDDEFRSKIEELSKSNPKDFSYLFKDGDRIYIPLSEHISVLDFEDRNVIIALKFAKIGHYIASDIDYINGYASLGESKNQISIAKILNKEIAYLKKSKKFFEEVMNDISGFIKQDNWIEIFISNSEKLYDNRLIREKLQDVNNEYEQSRMRAVRSIREVCEDLIDKCEYEITEADLNLKNFINSPARQGSNVSKAIIVISQSPHDIAQASYERAWTSCMNLASGSNKHCIIDEAKDGGLVAYLIREDDLDIKKPLSRILIRKYRSSDGKVIARVENQIYGAQSSAFLNAVKKFVEENINKNQEEDGYYKLTGGSYTDTLNPYIELGDKLYFDKIVVQHIHERFKTIYVSILRDEAFDFVYNSGFHVDTSSITNIKDDDFEISKELVKTILSPKAICHFVSKIHKADQHEVIEMIIRVFGNENDEYIRNAVADKLQNLDCSSTKDELGNGAELIKKDFIKLIESMTDENGQRFKLQDNIDKYIKDIIGETAAYALDTKSPAYMYMFACYIQEGLI